MSLFSRLLFDGRSHKQGRIVSVAGGECVLLVDGSTETEEVLKAVLEPRGLHVQRVRGDRHPPQSRDLDEPRVVVLHEENGHVQPRQESGASHSRSWDGVPRVIIGSTRDGSAQDSETFSEASPGDHHYLPFPFQYRDLVRAIDRLLSGETSRKQRAES